MKTMTEKKKLPKRLVLETQDELEIRAFFQYCQRNRLRTLRRGLSEILRALPEYKKLKTD
ncbi:MAG TPA: hypothetical protein PLV55_05970 [Anaerohalosphaeraceae bacterium]|nr:hypothetical protein [Anaerohalosphaeraceae bacterium]